MRFKSLRKSIANAKLEFKNSIRERVNDSKSRIEKTKALATLQLTSIKEEMKAKIAALEKRVVEVKDGSKKQYDRQLSNLKKSLASKTKKLEQALSLAGEE